MTEPEGSDEADRALWERLMTTPTELEFREFVLNRVAPDSGESVLSVGCGPGFESTALARRVGAEGTVTGVDVNGAVLAAAQDRCGDRPRVSFVRGDATELPVADGTYDLAIAKQALAGVADVESAIEELYRVVRPGGRTAVVAGDSRSHVSHTPSDRMERADEIYRAEMADRQLGTRLVGLLPEVGFDVEEVVPRAKLQTGINAQVERGIDVQRSLLESSDSFEDSDVDAWERHVRELAANGRFLSASIAFLYVAQKPA